MLTSVGFGALDVGMDKNRSLTEIAREFLEPLPRQRFPSTALAAMFRAAHPDVVTNAIALAEAWRANGLTRIKSNGVHYWCLPTILPELVSNAESERRVRSLTRYTVDLSPLQMQPGDGLSVTAGPGAITIRRVPA